METTAALETILESTTTEATAVQSAEFTAEQIEMICGTMELLQGCLMLFIAIVAIYILYLFINHFF